MKLGRLLNEVAEETWVCIRYNGKNHYLWSPDYIGWHPDTMAKLGPLLQREVEDFGVTRRKNPEEPKKQVSMILINLAYEG